MKVVFYHLPYEMPTKANYAHGIVAIAEGLRALGIEYYANIDYWHDHTTGNWLFNKMPPGYKADVAIYSNSFFEKHMDELDGILDPNQFNVLTDLSGFTWLSHWANGVRGYDLAAAYNHPYFDKFDLVLRNHGIKEYRKADNVAYWAYGLTNRMMETADKYRGEKVVPQVASNFRILHDLRKEAITRMEPILKTKYPIANLVTETLDAKGATNVSEIESYYWGHSGRRHSEQYYKFLNQSLLAYTFGGLIDILPITNNGLDKLTRQCHRVASHLFRSSPSQMGKHVYVFQHDSWRFWEVMYSSGCPIHMDFEDWGLILPEYPVNGKHYIGVKSWDFKGRATQITKMGDDAIAEIALAGKVWVEQHYAPVPTTERFLNLLKQYKV